MVTDVTQNAALEESFADELSPGTTLMGGQYRIEQFLNAGGFGITYTAFDTSNRRVVIKECFPSAFCRRDQNRVAPRSRAHSAELGNIIRLFSQEAKNLAMLDHPSIVGVHQVFEDNDTAYMVLDYVPGRDLLDIIENPDLALDPDVIQDLLEQMLDAIGYTHDMGVLHRDVSPDNILLGTHDVPVLIDFGAAREQASRQTRALSALRVVKDGYSPQEFYVAGADQGPYSDLYALAASFYHLISGELAPDAQSRLSAIAAGEADPYYPLLGNNTAYPDAFLAALDKAMAILPKDRMQSADEWLEALDDSLDVIAPPSGLDDTPTPRHRGFAFKALMAGGGIMAVLTMVAFMVPVTEIGSRTMAAISPEPKAAIVEAEDKVEPELRLEDKLLAAKPAEETPVEIASLNPFNVPKTTLPVAEPKEPASAELAGPKVEFEKTRHLSLPILSRDPITGERVRIFAVDGKRVTSQAQLDAILEQKITPVTGYFVRFTVQAGADAETARNQLRVLRVADRLTLPNGLSFQAVLTNNGWQTQTVRVPDTFDIDLSPGDVLVGDLKTSALLTEPDALDELFANGLRTGDTKFAFAVRRGSKTWATEFDLNDTIETN